MLGNSTQELMWINERVYQVSNIADDESRTFAHNDNSWIGDEFGFDQVKGRT